MLQKFKITSCAFILCLFGLTLNSAPDVSAEMRGIHNNTTIEKQRYDECRAHEHRPPPPTTNQQAANRRMQDDKRIHKCFRDLANWLINKSEEAVALSVDSLKEAQRYSVRHSESSAQEDALLVETSYLLSNIQSLQKMILKYYSNVPAKK
jgi:hypothetical protein